MKRKSDLLIHPNLKENGVYQSINPSSANWEFLSFEARKMKLNQSWDFETMGNEIAIVLLSGNFKVTSNRGNWETLNGRKSVFSGIAHTLYLPRKTNFTLKCKFDYRKCKSWIHSQRGTFNTRTRC